MPRLIVGSGGTDSGLTYERQFCPTEGPYADCELTRSDATVDENVYDNGKAIGKRVVFHQKGIEAPSFWSELAVKITAQKYFRGKVKKDGTPEPGRETSVFGLVDRVVDTIADWAGYADWHEGSDTASAVHKRTLDTDLRPSQVYFDSYTSWQAWKDDLKWLLIHQYMWFNSPVWFNVGIEKRPQCSACFILRVEDAMVSVEGDKEFSLDDHGLLAWQVKEGIIFTGGSGSGVNLSRIRSSKEHLSGGGDPTGPLSFARGPNAWANSIKSGGKTRRAAKMLILDIDHPDVLEFIRVKAEEEKIAKTLIAAGYPSDMDGVAYQHADHQNSNLSTRVNDAFMQAVDRKGVWEFVSRSHHFLQDLPIKQTMLGTPGRILETHSAQGIADLITRTCWESGDPGMQFADTIQKWNTCADEEPIFGTNPCSEYVFLDETSCNLASFNLRRFFPDRDALQSDKAAHRFVQAVSVLTIAMDVIVSNAHYPTPNIRKRSQRYRTIGVGYANLGGMLMASGIAYDSEEAQNLCGAITSAMCGTVYAQGALIARHLGSFEGFAANQNSFARVLSQHTDEAAGLFNRTRWGVQLAELGTQTFRHASVNAIDGFARNAQATVIAPTGTIAISMDCETTGIEPDFALIKHKQLAGGGNEKIVNKLVPTALRSLGYSNAEELGAQVLAADGCVRQVKGIWPEHQRVFATANPPNNDKGFYLPWTAHVNMMAAAQPFVSGAISKTVNLPNDATEQDIWGAYHLAWEKGLKAVALYRDGCKFTQPLSTQVQKVNETKSLPTMLLRFDKPITALGIPDTEQLLSDWSKERDVFVGQIKKLTDALEQRPRVSRRYLPEEYDDSTRRKFEIASHEGYMHIGFYPGTADPGEVFLRFSKGGSTVSGMMDAFCKCISLMLQLGMEFDDVLRKFEHVDFEPKGLTGDKDVPIARSVIDYIVRKMDFVRRRRGNNLKLVPKTELEAEPLTLEDEYPETPLDPTRKAGMVCVKCGSSEVVLNRNCVQCMACGSADGGCFGG